MGLCRRRLVFRDDAALQRVRLYIVNNPLKWALDNDQDEAVWR